MVDEERRSIFPLVGRSLVAGRVSFEVHWSWVRSSSKKSPAAVLAGISSESYNLEKDRDREDEERCRKWLNDMRGWLIVVATLIATCAYTTSLSPPGGFWQDNGEGHVAGDPILEDRSVDRFVVFRLFNSIALAQSFVVIIIVMRKTSNSEDSKTKSLVRALQILMVGSIAAISIAHATITVSYYYFKINVPYMVVIFLIVAQFITWLQPLFSNLSRRIKSKLEFYVKKVRPGESDKGKGVIIWIIVHVILRLGVIGGLLCLSILDSGTTEYWGNKYYKTGLFLLVPLGILLWWLDK